MDGRLDSQQPTGNVRLEWQQRGCIVQVMGLSDQSWLNGQWGTMVGREGHYWTVRMDYDDSVRLFNADNLKLDLETIFPHVRVTRMQERTCLNGQEGEGVAWDAQRDRWKVRMFDGSGILVKYANFEPVVTSSLSVNSSDTDRLLAHLVLAEVKCYEKSASWKKHIELSRDPMNDAKRIFNIMLPRLIEQSYLDDSHAPPSVIDLT